MRPVLQTAQLNAAAAPRQSSSLPTVCVATQLSEDRLPLLQYLAENWGGTVSAAVLVDDLQAAEERVKEQMRCVRLQPAACFLLPAHSLCLLGWGVAGRMPLWR